jgi:hypothetical protein
MRTLRSRAAYKLTVLVAVILLLDLAFLIYAAGEAHAATPHQHHHSDAQQQDQSGGDSSGDQSSAAPDVPATTPDDSVVPDQQPTALPGQGAAQTIQIALTGYARADNTPPDSTTISMPVIHQQAGGTCTWADPVTFASPGSAGSTEFPKGERVYFPKLKCVGISEDSGATKESVKHIDIYTGNGPASVTGPCEDALTGPATVEVNPPRSVSVIAGPLSDSTGNCRADQNPTTGTSTGVPDATDAPSGHARHTKHATADSQDDDN